jgi:hypothetical protein
MEKIVKFYSEQELKEIKNIIKNPKNNIKEAAIILAKKYDRTATAIEIKMYELRRKLHPQINLKKRKSTPKLKTTETVPVQQPAEIGVEVPNGMTFEGTPKKIMLHSDHFRIYF